MSFILDALKKSESDRQRQSGPSLFEVKVAPPRRTLPIWAVAIGILLVVNFIVISWMLLRHPAAQQAAPAATAPATPSATAMGSPAAPGETVPPSAPSGRADSRRGDGGVTTSGPGVSASVRDSGPASAGGAAPASGGAASAGAAAARDAASPTGSSQAPAAGLIAGGGADHAGRPPAGHTPGDDAPAVESAAAAGSGGSGGTSEDLPLYQQIVTSDGLPALHLDLHVFAARSGDRFVMINMHRLGEGESLPSGAQVEAIRPDGVVLTYHGTRFLLPRN